MAQPKADTNQHWLLRPATLRRVWIGFIAVLAATVLVQFLVPVEGHFGIEASFGFNAWYGLGTCVLMIVGAKLLGALLKRRDDYYDER
jgi:hypothetical protein